MIDEFAIRVVNRLARIYNYFMEYWWWLRDRLYYLPLESDDND